MKSLFGMLVEHCDSVTTPRPGLLLTGPLIGAPTNKYVTLRGAFSEPSRLEVVSVANMHRLESLYHTGLLIAEGVGAPAALRGAVVYDEGTLFRVFSAYVTCPPLSEAALFRFSDGTARGLVRVARNILDAFIIGGGLAEGRDLWAELQEIECFSGYRISANLLRPLGRVWAVPPVKVYESQGESKIVIGSCGPAAVDHPVTFVGSEAPITGHIITQQVSGLAQVSCGLKVNPPSALVSFAWPNWTAPALGEYL
jgi:hypothetical protein